MTARQESPIYLFQGFRLDAQRRLLFRSNGDLVALPPKVFDTLLFFVERPGELLSKRQLMAGIWRDVIVEENNLDRAISTLRRKLGERPGDHRYIVTEPGRGYRLVATVSVEEANTARADVGSPPRSNRRNVLTTSIVVAAGLLLVIVIGVKFQLEPRIEQASPTLVALLPFENQSPDVEYAYLAVGIHADILDKLWNLGLDVISREGVSRYADTKMSIQEIAAELDVDSILTGSISYNDERIEIIVHLFDASNGSEVWSRSYEGAFERIFSIESEISLAIATALDPGITSTASTALETPATTRPEALRAFYRARETSRQRNTPSDATALSYLDEAISIDPNFALAHSWEAVGYANLLISSFGVNAGDTPAREEVERLARLHADQALRLDSSQWLAHEALGRVHELSWRWSEARAHYEQAARVARPTLQQRWIFWRAMIDDPESMLPIQRQVVERNAMSANAHWQLAVLYAYSGDSEAAVASMNDAVDLLPSSPLMHLWLAHAEGMRGNSAAALNALRTAETLPGAHTSSLTIANLAYAYSWNYRPDEAERLWRLLAERAPDRRLDAGNWALAHLAVGDEDAAQRSLEVVRDKVAAEEPDAGYLALQLIRANIYSDPVLDKPTFRKLRDDIQGH